MIRASTGLRWCVVWAAVAVLPEVAAADCPEGVCLVTEHRAGWTSLRVKNTLLCPVTARITCTGLENVRLSKPVPRTRVIPPQSTKGIVSLRPKDPNLPWHPTYSLRFLHGSGAAVHDTAVRYVVPVDPAVPATMYPFGDGTKDGFLFGVPKGTRAYVARGGVVFFVGPDRENRYMVRIVHDDGTTATYIYLDRTAMAIDQGQTVEAGQPLGVTDAAGALLLVVERVDADAFRPVRVKIRFDDGSPEGFVAGVGTTVGG